MTKVVNDEIFLKDYARENNIYNLSSEDIIKLMEKPYIVKDIADAFNITVKEFNDIKKEKGIANIILETTIRNIEIILYYIDQDNVYISKKVRDVIVDDLAKILLTIVPKNQFYIQEISNIDFNREKVLNDIVNKDIDIEYRLKKLDDIVAYIKEKVKKLVNEEKEYFLNYNNEKLYKKLCNELQNGKKFTKDDLTYDILFELAIIENIPDSMIANIYNLSINQVRYLRKKSNLSDKFKCKVERFPEMIIYFMEENNARNYNISNYEYENVLKKIIENRNISKEKTDNLNSKYKITIDVEGGKRVYEVEFSDELYNVNNDGKEIKRRLKGVRHNYKKENETKMLHGTIGEQIAIEAEKKRLQSIGLYKQANDIELVARVGEEVTFDGQGYDMISFNELGEKICIEVKTSYSKKDRPFFISDKEIELIRGLYKEYDCKQCVIYYVLIDEYKVTIKNIKSYDFDKLKLTPILYKIG